MMKNTVINQRIMNAFDELSNAINMVSVATPDKLGKAVEKMLSKRDNLAAEITASVLENKE